MNKIKLLTFLLVALTSKSIKAQESFLRLDSIVVIEDSLVVSSSGNGSHTIAVSLGSNQLVQSRNASISVKTSGGFIKNDDNVIYDMSISAGNIDLMDIVNWARNGNLEYYGYQNAWYFSGSFNIQSRSLLTFNEKSDYLFTEDFNLNIDYRWNESAISAVFYRIELIYYSYE